MSLIIPAPRNAFDLTMGDGAVIKIRQHGNPDGVRIMLSNGNGFAPRPPRSSSSTGILPLRLARESQPYLSQNSLQSFHET